ncbi:MAG TPA: HemK/PrmC family methyltransferase [Candidatus Saccharimonadales bacterium]
MSLTSNDWLAAAQRQLAAAGVGTARLDALVLLEDQLNKYRTHILAHPEIVLSAQDVKILARQLARRAKHEPLAYIRGHTEFYGRDFSITPAVLEPRPESETMIELLLQQPDLPPQPRIADVGTGSGALGITAQLELPHAIVDLLEIDPAAAKIAQKNVIKFTTGQKIIISDLLEQTSQHYDILLCNLPYVPDNFHINEAALAEPKIAIFGGGDGLDVYRRLFMQLQTQQNKPLLILCESLPPQHDALTSIAAEAQYSLRQTEDFIQVFSLQHTAHTDR